MARYFFNISELLDAGQSIDDVKIEVYYDENKASYDGPAEVRGPIKYDDAGTYYVEVDWSGRIIYGKREIQLALISSLDSNYKSNWNPENDYSREGLGKEFVRTEKIPLYLNGVKVFGNEPPQIEPSPDAFGRTWCGFAFWFGGFCIFHGPDWSVDQGCNGLRHGTECHNRLRPDGFHFCRRKVS